jgi:signal transduction histidine kinase
MRRVGSRNILHQRVMTVASNRSPIEPLFASNGRLWLRVWAVTQTVALIVVCYIVIDGPGGIERFLTSRDSAQTIAAVVSIAAYHAIAVSSYGWILRRRWAVSLFVALGWALIVAAITMNTAFSLLVLGAILQGFIFLPFGWGIATLTLIVLLSLAEVLVQSGRQGWDANLTLARIVGLFATGLTVGAVMLYIHRSNRDASIRSQLLHQLDDAQRDLAERSRESGVQEERQRLARDIHDTLAQGFTSVIKHLEAIELFVGRSSNDAGASLDDIMARARPHLASAQAVSRESLAEIRRLVWALRPPQLVETTLPAALERIVAQWSEANDVAATCTIGVLPPLQADVDVIFLRATQESLSNVARHARATRVGVSMQCVDELVLLSVEDDGCGFTNLDDSRVEHMGLTGMRERVRPFGGHILIESDGGTGTSITVALPLAAITLPRA